MYMYIVYIFISVFYYLWRNNDCYHKFSNQLILNSYGMPQIVSKSK